MRSFTGLKKLSFAITAAFLFLLTPGPSDAARPDGINPCLGCHETITPGIVHQWKGSSHSPSVNCLTCHRAQEEDPSGYNHNGYVITVIPSPAYCGECHPDEVAGHSRSKHGWAAFMGPLKPYYEATRESGLDPLAQSTAKKLDPERMAKTSLSTLFPDSGILSRLGLLGSDLFEHENVSTGCMACHGSFVIAGDNGALRGWPNTGVGRINPDGTRGACTACHSRHTFSRAEARRPETCGQCHLGPDHPQAEIYAESKHGNIYAERGDKWNWDAPVGSWGPDDIETPTCATCHMSGFGSEVASTHDVGRRLHWELQARKSTLQWSGPPEVDFVIEQVPNSSLAGSGRATMKQVCYQCHSPRWVDAYFESFDRVVLDYNAFWEETDRILEKAYADGLLDPENPIDEVPEIMHYLIWHHDGRRWRMGAAMMGPDWTHWNGAVDAIMLRMGVMLDRLETERRLRRLEEKGK